MRYRRKFFAKAVLVVLIIALLGWLVMGLWNWIVPALVVGAHAIDYPRAIGLLVLCRILFGGFRGHGGCRMRGGMGADKARHWRNWQQWQQMSQEERDRFREERRTAPGEGANP
jgi:hypothetical protein